MALTTERVEQRLEDAITEAIIYIIDEGLAEITPEYDPERGFIYPGLEEVVRKYGYSDIDILEELTRRGVLRQKLYKRVVECPVCGSSRLVASFKCPNCGSPNLTRNTLVTHIPCGYIGVFEEMDIREGKRVCPKCSLLLEKPGEDYERIGTVYACKECGYRTEMPVPAYECVACGKSFDHREAVYRPYYAYEVEIEELLKVEKDLLKRLISRKLKEAGLSVDVDVTVTGRSGLPHMADIRVVENGKVVFVDIISSKQDFLRVMGKWMDMPDAMQVILLRSALPPDTIPKFLVESDAKIIRFDKVGKTIDHTVREVLSILGRQESS